MFQGYLDKNPKERKKKKARQSKNYSTYIVSRSEVYILFS